MELPIDHFRLLGVSPSAGAEEVLRAFQLRLDRSPQKGLTYEVLSQRSELLRLSADLLSDKSQRQSYELALLEGASGLELSSNREVAGLLLLWEAKASYQAFKLARKALQPPQAPALGSGREADLTIIAALACRDAALEEQIERRYSSAADLLQEGIQLLQRMGKLPEERKTLENDLELLLPYRILDLLSREDTDVISHTEGIRLLDNFVIQRGGIEGRKKGNPSKICGLTQNDFELFFQQIRNFLTVEEQIGLFSSWNKRGSSDAGFLAAISMVAAGFAYRKPEKLQEARKYFKNLNIQGIDSMPLVGCIDLLLADVKQSEARFKSSTDSALKNWLDEYPGEGLAALCDYCRNWLGNDVLPGYRDITNIKIDLEEWFANKEVQEYVEIQETKSQGALGIAKAGFSLFSPSGNDKGSPEATSYDSFNEGESSLPVPGGIFEKDFEERGAPLNHDDEDSVKISNYLQGFINSVSSYPWSLNVNLLKEKLNANPIILSASVFTILFIAGTSIGLLNQNKKTNFNSTVQKKENINVKQKEKQNSKIKVKSLNNQLTTSKDDISFLVDPMPSNGQIRALIESWLKSKSDVLFGNESQSLTIVARDSLVKRVLEERKKDMSLGEKQKIRAVVNSMIIEQRTNKRIAVIVELNYKDQRFNSAGKSISETTIPSLKVKYVLGRDKEIWKLVDYVSGG